MCLRHDGQGYKDLKPSEVAIVQEKQQLKHQYNENKNDFGSDAAAGLRNGEGASE